MRFRECSKRSQYVRCNGHILNLITKDYISEVPVLRNTLGTIQALNCFLEVQSKVSCHIHETATSCSAERSFSSLRRLKTYLRNTMSQDRPHQPRYDDDRTRYVNRVLNEDMDKLINTFGSKLIIFNFPLHLNHLLFI